MRVFVGLMVGFYFATSLFFIFSDSGSDMFVYIQNLIRGIHPINHTVDVMYSLECLGNSCDYFLFQFKYTLLVFVIIFSILFMFNSYRMIYESICDVGNNGSRRDSNDKNCDGIKSLDIKYPALAHSYIPLYIRIVYVAKSKHAWSSYIFDLFIIVAAVMILTPLDGDSMVHRIFSFIVSYLIISQSSDKILELILLLEALTLHKLTVYLSGV